MIFERNIYLGMDAKKLHDMDLLSRGSGNIVALKKHRIRTGLHFLGGEYSPHGLGVRASQGLGGLQGDPRQLGAGRDYTPQVGWDKMVV